MTDYTKLVKALRCENTGDDECGSSDCTYWSGLGCMDGQLMEDAADAIEELQDKVVELEEELNDADVAADDNGRQVEKLQAEIERLKDSNEELREKQTYIDHYGIEWLTSAKDVPNYAYEHGYADGMAEVKAQLPKREAEYTSTMTTQDERNEWGIVKKLRFYRKAVKWLWRHRAEDNNRHKWRRMMREVQE